MSSSKATLIKKLIQSLKNVKLYTKIKNTDKWNKKLLELIDNFLMESS